MELYPRRRKNLASTLCRRALENNTNARSAQSARQQEDELGILQVQVRTVAA
jgi:hypothetical protein